MTTPVQIQSGLSVEQSQVSHWTLPLRIGFRFCFIYFGLYCLLTQILGALIPIPIIEIPDLGALPPFRQIVLWTANHVFQYKHPVVYTGSGSGDKVWDWVQMFCLLVFASMATCVWSIWDRRRTNYGKLYLWFRVFVRFALASQLISYGINKIAPMQMPFPYLLRLVELYGNFSPMGVLWSSIGAAPAYETFVGSAELLAGLLLIVPATSMVGAIICVFDVIEVFALNMTYDVPVKLFSFHLLLMAAFLLIPERSRLLRFCFFDCAVDPPVTRRLFASGRANRIATATQITIGLLMLASALYGTQQGWSKWGPGAPKSPLYGIWNVDEMAIDGAVRSPLLTDYGRWRRIIFEFPESITFQRMDDSFVGFGLNLESKQNTLALTKWDDKTWKGQLAFHRLGTNHMTLDGQMGPRKVRMQLSLMDRNKFLLVNRGFHWIQDYPFNR